jgi:hypothetical protein
MSKTTKSVNDHRALFARAIVLAAGAGERSAKRGRRARWNAADLANARATLLGLMAAIDR